MLIFVRLRTVNCAVTDLKSFSNYLRRLLPPLLSAEPNEISDLLASNVYNELAPRFAAESAVPVVYVVKSKALATDGTTLDVEGECARYSLQTELMKAPADSARFTYALTTEMTYHASHVAMLAFIKRVPSLDSARPLDSQMHFVNFPGPAAFTGDSSSAVEGSVVPGASPYEALHSLVHLAVAPYFDAFVNSKSDRRPAVDTKGKDADAKMGASRQLRPRGASEARQVFL